MNALIARQPIVDAAQRIFAYELLYRSEEGGSFASLRDDELTGKLAANLSYSFEQSSVLTGKPCFMNFGEHGLRKQLYRVFEPEQLIIEILETVTPGPEAREACERAKREGYRLALDDYDWRQPPEILHELADFVKVDVLATPMDVCRDLVRRFQPAGVTLLAEKVETHTQFGELREMGYQLFQGYYFEKPKTLQSKRPPGMSVRRLQILRTLLHGELDLRKLAPLIAQEATIAFRLLRYANSAMHHSVNPIRNLDQCLTYLGEDKVRTLLMLVVLQDLGAQSNEALMEACTVRAAVCRGIAERAGEQSGAEPSFLTGLLSLLDAMVVCPMETALEGMPLDPEIRAALLGCDGGGTPQQALALARAWERADWDSALSIGSELGLRLEDLQAVFSDSLLWARDLAAAGR
ncbi:MAG TPA: hypothetical protein DEH78_24795 [Solibacterales bacterium]|nr:hypothetical protein [Bryobacterales bacterium]